MLNVIATIALLASVTLNGLTVTRSSLFGYTVRGKVLDASEAAALIERAAEPAPSLGARVALAVASHRAAGRLTVTADLGAPYERVAVQCSPRLGVTVGDVVAFGRIVAATLRAAGFEACQAKPGRVLAWKA